MTVTTRTPSRSRPITGSNRLRAARFALIATTALTPLWLPTYAHAEGMPTGGQVVQGAAQIAQPSATQMNVNQSSQRAVVNWDGFSVGQGNAVRFNQPNSNSAILNRVTGDMGSRIDGSISANGHVYLVNPRGVVVGPTGRVDAQGFVASSLQIEDDDFMSGRLRFDGNGASAAVENHGAITVGHGGMAALLGGKVSNTGTIVAPLGRVGFGAGERATIDLSGDGFLQIALPSGAEGETLIEQAGRVSADGGLIEMHAATARDAARRVVNLSGVTEARSVSGRDGRIVLGGGAGGTVRVTGSVSTAPSATLVDASPRPAERPNIVITGRDIELAGATIDASGEGGGGSIRIGGDFAGQGDLLRADTVSVDAASTIDVSATGTGAGGEAAIWSDVETVFFGGLDARGADGGPGGFVEVSSAKMLTFDSAVQVGEGGTLWLDPENFEICETVDCGGFGSQVTPLSLTSVIDGGGLAVVDTSTGDVPLNSGRITVSSTVASSGTGTLRLLAQEDILIQAPISLPNGILELSAAQEIFPGVGITAGPVNVDRFTLLQGSWLQQQLNPAAFSANDFRLGFGTTFLRAAGQGTAASPFRVNDVYGLQGMASFGTAPTVPGNPVLLDSVWELGGNIDATGTSGWWDSGESVDGFRPIGESAPFTGTLEGRGFAIDGLFTAWNTFGVGMFAATDGALINDLALTNVTVDTFGTEVGGLIGFSEFTDLSNVSVSGSVSTSNISFGGEGPFNTTIGGVAGEFQGGSMSNVSFDGAVDVFNVEDQTVRAGGVAGLVSSSTGTMDDIRAGLVSGVSVTIDGDGNALAGGIFGELDTLGDLGFTNLVGDTTVVVTLDDNPESFEADSNASVGGLIGASRAPSGSIEVLQSSSVVVADVTQSSDFGADIFVGGMFGDLGNTFADALTVHDVVVDVVTDGFVNSTVGGFAGFVGPGGSIAATPFEPVRGVVTVTADENTAVGGLVGRNLGEILNQDADMTVEVEGVNAFLSGIAMSVGGSVGVNTGRVFDSFTGGSISVNGTGTIYVGGVAGVNAGDGAIVESSWSGGLGPQSITVGSGGSPVGTDDIAVGGLVGSDNFSTILDSEANTSIEVFADNLLGGDTFKFAGGLVGRARGSTITNGQSSGTLDVTATSPNFSVGGFVGALQEGSISVARSFVDVSVNSNFDAQVGGFAGLLDTIEVSPSVTDAKATGNVQFTEVGSPIVSGRVAVGGFAGEIDSSATVTRASAEGSATATTTNLEVAVGGFVGINFGIITDAYARGDARNAGSVGNDWVGGFAGVHLDTITNALSTGAAIGIDNVGGAVGIDVQGFSSGLFWDTTASGNATSAAGVGLTTAEIQDTAGFQSLAPFDFFNVWAPGDLSGIYPQIYTIDPVVYALPDDQTIVYGDTPPIFTGTVYGGPDLYVFDFDGDTLDTSAVFAGLPVPGTDAGEYPLTGAPSTALSANSITYTVIYGEGLYSVTPAPLEITTLDQTKTFGAAGFALAETEGAGWEITGGALVTGDTIASVPLDSPGEAVDAPVGTYPITVSGDPVGTGVQNYAITFVELGQLTVNEAVVVLNVLLETLDQRKIYGDATFALAETEGAGWQIVGGDPFIGDDGIDLIALTSTGTAVTAPVGAYEIVAGEIFGTGLGNYNIQINEIGQLFVDPRAIDLTITTLDQSRLYGGGGPLDTTEGIGWVPTGTPDFVNGDALTGVSLTSEGNAATSIVGQYPIAVSGLSGPGISNYIITFANEGVLDVTPAPLTLTTLDQANTYGNDFALAETEGAGWTIMAGELFNEDAVATVELDSAGESSLAPVGVYEIVSGVVTGEGLSNYDITVLEEGALTVTPRSLTITPDDQTKPQGDTFGFAGDEFTDSGLVNGNTVTSVDLFSAGAAAAALSADSPFDIVASNPQGEGLGNYDITFGTGTFTVTPGDAPEPPGDVLEPPPIDIVLPPRDPGLPSQGDATIGSGTTEAATTAAASAASAQSVEVAESVLAVIERASSDLQAAVSACRESDAAVTDLLGCISEALESYSATLDPANLDLPQELAGVSSAVIEARNGIDAARARAQSRLAGVTDPDQRRQIELDAISEARTALQTAEQEVTRALTLIRADDPELASVYREQASTVIAALNSVETELQRAVGL